jgi:hypothetical protein
MTLPFLLMELLKNQTSFYSGGYRKMYWILLNTFSDIRLELTPLAIPTKFTIGKTLHIRLTNGQTTTSVLCWWYHFQPFSP